jgi:hypothetical protein
MTTAWTVRGSNPGGDEIFRTCPDRPWNPHSLLYNGYRVFPGVKSGRGVSLTPQPVLLPWSWKSRAIPLLPLWAVRPYRDSVPVQGWPLPSYFYYYWRQSQQVLSKRWHLSTRLHGVTYRINISLIFVPAFIQSLDILSISKLTNTRTLAVTVSTTTLCSSSALRTDNAARFRASYCWMVPNGCLVLS